jgi:hypothetical protein
MNLIRLFLIHYKTVPFSLPNFAKRSITVHVPKGNLARQAKKLVSPTLSAP